MTIRADEHLLEVLRSLPEPPPLPPSADATPGWLPDLLFEDQAASRHADLAARWLQTQGRGYYTIASAGHEGNAVLATALRPTDPALLHYRSGAFFVARARQAGMELDEALEALLLGVVASTEDPISGGRHKVIGHRELAIIPQTSTIASHLPRALGVAVAISRADKLDAEIAWPTDSIVVCSFGDASVNHSTAVGAINASAQAAYQNLPLPVLWVCEDNGLGISVRTPAGWVAHRHRDNPSVRYFEADGSDPATAVGRIFEAAEYVRQRRRPAFLHLHTVRLMSHAGSDVETAYRSPAEIAADLDRDPLIATARLLSARGALSGRQIEARYEDIRSRAMTIAKGLLDHPTLASSAVVTRPIELPRVIVSAPHRARVPERAASPGDGTTLAQAINRGLATILREQRDTLLFGEDVARKGGVYGVTRGLAREFGPARVFDTLLDEQTILGLALGLGVSGLVALPEIQYLAYLHNAEDQLRGEAASLRFFSNGQHRNPMVVRVAGLAYQKGFGGHFHNDNSVAVLGDIPGLAVAVPSHPRGAEELLRQCVELARTEGAPVVFLEPIALYHQRDLFDPGDGRWTQAPDQTQTTADAAPFGRSLTYGDGQDLTLVSFGNGVPMSLRAARRLGEEHGVAARVVDLRWLRPLPVADLLAEASATGRVLVVDETRRSGGVSEGILAALVDAEFDGVMRRVTSVDSFVPLGPAADQVLLSEDQIVEQALKRFRQ